MSRATAGRAPRWVASTTRRTLALRVGVHWIHGAWFGMPKGARRTKQRRASFGRRKASKGGKARGNGKPASEVWRDASDKQWRNVPTSVQWHGETRSLGNTKFPGSPLPLANVERVGKHVLMVVNKLFSGRSADEYDQRNLTVVRGPSVYTVDGWSKWIDEHGTGCEGGAFGVNIGRRVGVGSYTLCTQAIPVVLGELLAAAVADIEAMLTKTLGPMGKQDLARLTNLRPGGGICGSQLVTGAFFMKGPSVPHVDPHDVRGALSWVFPLTTQNNYLVVHPAWNGHRVADEDRRLYPGPLVSPRFGVDTALYGSFSAFGHGPPQDLVGVHESVRLTLTIYADIHCTPAGACCGAKNTHKANKKRAVYTMPRAGASAKRHGRGRAGDDSGVC